MSGFRYFQTMGVVNNENAGVVNNENAGVMNNENAGVVNNENAGVVNNENAGVVNNQNVGVVNNENAAVMNKWHIMGSCKQLHRENRERKGECNRSCKRVAADTQGGKHWILQTTAPRKS